MNARELHKKTVPLMRSLIRARKALRCAEDEYDRHKNDFEFDRMYQLKRATAKLEVQRLLDRLENLWQSP